MNLSQILLTLAATSSIAIHPTKASLPLPDQSAFAAPVRRPADIDDAVGFLRQLFAVYDDVATTGHLWQAAPLNIINMTYRFLFEEEFQVTQDNQWHDLIDWALTHINNTPRSAFQQHLVGYIITHRLLEHLPIAQLQAIVANITLPEPLRRRTAYILIQHAPTKKRPRTFTDFNSKCRRQLF